MYAKIYLYMYVNIKKCYSIWKSIVSDMFASTFVFVIFLLPLLKSKFAKFVKEASLWIGTACNLLIGMVYADQTKYFGKFCGAARCRI